MSDDAASHQAELAQLRLALQQRSDEQQAFLRVVSHDLRSPVRHIVAYGQLVRELVQESNADPAALQYLDTMAQSARQLGQMIDGLISLGRIEPGRLQPQTLPLQPLLQDLVAARQAGLDGRQIEWQLPAEGATVWLHTDLGLLRDLLNHLLDNALKFSRRQAPAHIAIGLQAREGEVELSLRDNGAGFNADYTDQLFGVFKRLHSSSEFEGLGLGLAASRRIVECLGGRIAIEGATGQGCRVSVVLPTVPEPRL
ncbi:MAG: two-component sensor histidine kinase [Curvibacter sp.]|nr:two-component sensor histidine kinase [Curvibacter sp.]